MGMLPEFNANLHPKQGEILLTPANEILYGGAAGGGKSFLMRVVAVLLCSLVPNIQVYLFRRNFSDLYKNHMEGPGGLPAILGDMIRFKLVKINFSKNEIRFWNNAVIHLCHLNHAKDLLNYQGSEIHVLLMDELTHFLESEYRFLRNRMRLGGLEVPPILLNGLNLKDRLPLMLAGSNPGGPGHVWVKRTFVDYCRPMELVRMPKKDGGMLRTYCPAKLEDNPTLMLNDPDYESRLEGLGDPALVKAMRHGDWNIVAGGALDDVFKDRNILPRFKIPPEWKVNRSMDWGSAAPASIGWWAESNGEEIQYKEWRVINGKAIGYLVTRSFPKGTLIRICEWYLTPELGTNKGLRLSPKKVSKGIKEIEEKLIRGGWVSSEIMSGPADSSIWDDELEDNPSIATQFGKEGIYWTRANKKAGTRKLGLVLMRQMLEETEGPGLYFMENCKAALVLLPQMQRDPIDTEDVDTKTEDHLYDEVRYRVLDTKIMAKEIKGGYNA